MDENQNKHNNHFYWFLIVLVLIYIKNMNVHSRCFLQKAARTQERHVLPLLSSLHEPRLSFISTYSAGFYLAA